MSSFEQAIPILMAHEGGYINNPDDPGGPTNWGISTLLIQREGITPQELQIPDLSADGIRLMPRDAAIACYQRRWWDRYGYAQIDDWRVATKLFDFGVNANPGYSHRIAQLSVTAMGHPVPPDGVLGPKTFAAINACDPAPLLMELCDWMRCYYRSLAVRNPKLAQFQTNWLRRAQWVG